MSKKESEEFLKFFRSLYGEPRGEDGKYTIPHCKESLKEEHEKLRREFIKKLLGPKRCKQKYTHRGGRTETLEEYYFNSLWYNYGPYFDLSDE